MAHAELPGMQKDYSYLDQSQFRSLYCDLQKPRTMKFFVEGIRCSKCIGKIENLRNQIPEVQTLEVDLANQTAQVELRSNDSSFATVAEAIDGLGFRAIPIQPEEDVTEKWKKESRKDLVRLAVAGFCAGNIMTLAFATYFGLSGEMKAQFEWLQFALYLPVVAFVALPFYQGFFSGLKNRSFSIDGPMAIASFLGFSVSTWNLFQGSGSIYFDSLSGFLFLILATRYLQKRTRFEYLKFLRPSALTETFKARLLESATETTSWKWVRSDQLKKDDVILVEQGDWIPADGELLDSEAVLDLSVLDGEPFPRRVQKGFAVKAGSRLLSASIRLNVNKSGAQTLLGHLLSSIKRETFEEAGFSKLSDKAAQILLQVVLAMAVGLLLFGLAGNFESYFERALALIILACPCAMAFGTPLAFSFSMKRAQDRGMLVKSAQVFENLGGIKTVYLDKTGTLTERFWNLTSSSLNEIPTYFQQIILSLESKSQHPIAFALREIWIQVQIPSSMELNNFKEMPGVGVSGEIQGKSWEFRSFQEQGQKWFGLYENQELVWRFQLNPVLQEGAKESVLALQQRGLEVCLLSGDSKVETHKMAEALGIPRDRAFGDLAPKDKLQIVQKTENCMMVGDGVNDTLALQAAGVGIAVKGGVDLTLQSADVLFLNEGLSSLTEILKVAGQARRQIRKNLASALIYNLIGAAAAILGWVNPFVAALLMPASSLYILGTTWWGTRK